MAVSFISKQLLRKIFLGYFTFGVSKYCLNKKYFVLNSIGMSVNKNTNNILKLDG
jgi:hypothetical protein